MYRARDSRLDHTVAIKVLPSHLASDPNLLQRFDREARTISSLSHPNISSLYDVGSQEDILPGHGSATCFSDADSGLSEPLSQFVFTLPSGLHQYIASMLRRVRARASSIQSGENEEGAPTSAIATYGVALA